MKAAELVKLYENVFRNVGIPLANGFPLMCRLLRVSTKEAIDAAETKPFGFMPFYPWPGITDYCHQAMSNLCPVRAIRYPPRREAASTVMADV